MWRCQKTNWWLGLLGLTSFLLLCGMTFSSVEAFNEEVEDAFDPDDDEDSIQRKYVINVANKAEDCYFIPDIKVNQVLNFHFVVSLVFS